MFLPRRDAVILVTNTGRTLAAFGLLAVLSTAAPASAVINYELRDVTFTNHNTEYSEYPIAPKPFTFTVSDEAVAAWWHRPHRYSNA